jgi:hypothetical protein
VFAEVFPVAPPARTAAVVGLAGGRRISIEVTAVVPHDGPAPALSTPSGGGAEG